MNVRTVQVSPIPSIAILQKKAEALLLVREEIRHRQQQARDPLPLHNYHELNRTCAASRSNAAKNIGLPSTGLVHRAQNHGPSCRTSMLHSS